MKMSQTLIASSNGLTALVNQLQSGGMYSLGAAWRNWFEAAAEQLENDDSLDARLTDEMADALGEAEAAICEGRNSLPALNRLVSLYHRGQAELSLEAKWTKKAQMLGLAQLESPIWNDLHSALDAAEAGKVAPVARWIEMVEERFIATWESYEAGDVLENEVTTESVLGHRFLRDGAELWLSALGQFKDSLAGGLDRGSILAQAEEGQRLLVVMQILEQEADEALDRFFSWAKN
jgi:hypothetical protein